MSALNLFPWLMEPPTERRRQVVDRREFPEPDLADLNAAVERLTALIASLPLPPEVSS